jgi:hypothetical protein
MLIINKLLTICFFGSLCLSCDESNFYGDTEELSRGYTIFNDYGKIKYLRCSDNDKFDNQILLPVFVINAEFINKKIVGSGWVYETKVTEINTLVDEIQYHVKFDVDIPKREIVISKSEPKIDIKQSGLLNEAIVYRPVPVDKIFEFKATSGYKVINK